MESPSACRDVRLARWLLLRCVLVAVGAGGGLGACGREAQLVRQNAERSSGASGGLDQTALRFDAGAPAVTGVAGDTACAKETIVAERVALDLYLMLDSSYSMLDQTSAGTDKWDAVKAALRAFMRAPASSGIGLGLQFFPLVNEETPEECFAQADCGERGPCLIARTCAPASNVRLCSSSADCSAGQSCVLLGVCNTSGQLCTDIGRTCGGRPGDDCLRIPGYCQRRDRCEAEAYAAPTVEVAALPDVAPRIEEALAFRRPQGRTPTGPALAGALGRARAQMQTHPGRRTAVVLASDGFPSACLPNDIESVATLAAEAYQGTPSISTFAIGVVTPGETEDALRNLGAIATAGGTERAYVIDTEQDVTGDFLEALNAIRSSALPCAFKLPRPQSGQLDYTRINVLYTDETGQVSTLGNVQNATACDPGRGGWYYDADPRAGTPSTIVACDSTCSALQAGAKGRVDIVLGCRTVFVD